MILLTDELREQLLANGRRRDTNHVAVVKFFNPLDDGFPISIWAEEARQAGGIRDAERILYRMSIWLVPPYYLIAGLRSAPL